MKKLIILFIPFLLTGCASVTYDLEIEKDLKVVESINMSATREYFNNFYMNLPITIIREAYENEETMSRLKNNNYEVELRKDNVPYPSVFATKKYDSINQFVTDTVYNGQMFEEIYLENKDNLITIKTSKSLPYAPDDSSGDSDSRYPISNLTIKIKLPFVVKESNADDIEKSSNTYTWYIDEKTVDKEINITFDKSKVYIYNKSLYISVTIIVIISVILIIYILRMINRNRKNNSLR